MIYRIIELKKWKELKIITYLLGDYLILLIDRISQKTVYVQAQESQYSLPGKSSFTHSHSSGQCTTLQSTQKAINQNHSKMQRKGLSRASHNQCKIKRFVSVLRVT